MVTSVQTPHEQCDIAPVKTCNIQTKLLPRLEPVETCSEVSQWGCQTQRMPLSIKDLNSFQNVGTRTSIFWQTLESIFKKLFLHFHFPPNLHRHTSLDSLYNAFTIYYSFISVTLCTVMYATEPYSSSNEQIFKASKLDQTS